MSRDISESYFVILSCILWLRRGHTLSFLSTHSQTNLLN